MAKYEYMTVVFGYTEAIAATGSKPWKVNEVELKNWKKGLDRITYLNNLGAEGWELAVIDVHDMYIFRRTMPG